MLLSPKQQTAIIEKGDQLFKNLYTLNKGLTSDDYKGLYQNHNLGIEAAYNKSQEGIVNTVSSWMSVSSWAKFANRSLYGDLNHANTRRDYLAAIICLMWSLDNKAKIDQKKNMQRGSFKIIDPEGKLYTFLLEYTKFATGNNSPGFFSANSFAYSRNPEYGLSSHYKDAPNQFGIDMRFFGDAYTTAILPANNPHLLFGQIKIDDQNYTFIKFEPAGLGDLIEYIHHGTDFIHSLHSKPDLAKSFREKDVSKELQHAFDKFINMYNNYMQQPFKKLKENNVYTILESVIAMYETLQQSKKLFSDNTIKNIEKHKTIFFNTLINNAIDNPDIRHGNEIILDYSQNTKAKTPAKDKKRTRSLPPPITTTFHNKKKSLSTKTRSASNHPPNSTTRKTK